MTADHKRHTFIFLIPTHATMQIQREHTEETVAICISPTAMTLDIQRLNSPLNSFTEQDCEGYQGVRPTAFNSFVQSENGWWLEALLALHCAAGPYLHAW